MHYREAAPAPLLRPAVVSHWTVTGGVAGRTVRQSIYPDGCFDLLFVLRGTIANEGGALPGGAYVVGPMTRAARVCRKGDVAVLGVRFRPGVASRLMRVPMSELRDNTVAAADLMGPGVVDLADQLASAADFAAQVRLVEARLVDWLGRTSPGAATDVLQAGIGERVSTLVQRTGLSERQVQRIFLRDVGLTPTEVVRLRRFRRALQLLDRRHAGSLSAFAFELGFSDHAHFTREFTAFAGVSPSAWVQDHVVARGTESDLFKQD